MLSSITHRRLPASFSAGSTVAYQRSLASFPASQGWTYQIFLVGPEVSKTFTGTANGDAFDVVLPAADTAQLPAGDYRFLERLVQGDTVRDAEHGTVAISPDLATATSFKSKNKALLDAIDALLLGRSVDGIESYSINGRQINKMQLKDLREWRGHIAFLVWRENSGGKFGPSYQVEFKRTGL